LYNEALQQLVAAGQVFACTCSRADVARNNLSGIYPGTCREKALPLDTPGACWRFRTPGDATVNVNTLTGIVTAALPQEMTDFVIRKKDGFPAYQLTSVVDDVHFSIDLIVRGADLWPSTIAQHLLACVPALSAFRAATFYHHPLVTGPDGQKLSKSAGATSIQYLRQQGLTAAKVLELAERG
jgi:glutamyl-tRNA synthetase